MATGTLLYSSDVPVSSVIFCIICRELFKWDVEMVMKVKKKMYNLLLLDILKWVKMATGTLLYSSEVLVPGASSSVSSSAE